MPFEFDDADDKPFYGYTPYCISCKLGTINKAIPYSTGNSRTLVVFEKPNASDYKRKSKQMWEQCCKFVDVTHGVLISDLNFMYALQCPGADEKAIKRCVPYFIKTIKEINPVCIILVGELALKTYTYAYYGDTTLNAVDWHIPDRILNAWVCPVIKTIGDTKEGTLFFKNQVTQALRYKKRPYKKGNIPDVKQCVQPLYDLDTIISVLDKTSNILPDSDLAVAFDYECNCLLPEHPKATVLSASLCIGKIDTPIDKKKTYAFQWQTGKQSKELHEAWFRFLRSPCKKIASNLKFEDRWSRVHFKTPVKNWVLDTTIAAHMWNSKPGITGLKDQAFFNLGVYGYEKEFEKYLDTDKEGLNKVSRMPIEKLLLYNGLDSLLEHELAAKQLLGANLDFHWKSIYDEETLKDMD
jgi:hypothetical protein